MNHSFNVEFARRYGVREAILIENIDFWITKNTANQKHFHKGRYWTYNSVKAWADLFPYLSPKQVRSGLEHLVARGVLVVDNFNASTYDRTSWYAFSDYWLEKKRQMHLSERANGFAPAVESLTSTDINTDVGQQDHCPHSKIVEAFKKALPEARQVRQWTAARQSLLRARWKEAEERQDLKWWDDFFQYIASCDFLMGKVTSHGRKPFELSLDWLLKEENFVKILEGTYEN